MPPKKKLPLAPQPLAAAEQNNNNTILQPKTPKIAALTAAANRLKQNNTPIVILPDGTTVVAPPVVVESHRYEEWMKLATDNKITSTNAWNFALIDYFADMSLLRNGDDNSINFQKASCTLDGCVKIWTSRVDSVATETGKLLSGLAEDGRNGANMGDDDDDEDGDADEDAKEARQQKRKAARQASTLADNFSKIKVKAFDLEFTVDPLFKKTSADFDEGGAGGILMNHLGCDASMRVVFDAGDAKLEDDEDKEAQEEEEEEEEYTKLDISKLRNKFLPSMELFAQMTLCPSLASFRFSPDANLDLGILNPIDEELSVRLPPQLNAHFADDDDDNPFEFPEGAFEGGGGDEDGPQDFFNDSNDNHYGGGEGGGGEDEGGHGQGGIDPFDPRRVGNGGERDLVMSMAGNGEQMFEHFDSALTKNWAGPEHWKMRRIAVKKDDTVGVARPRKEKTTFFIDLSLPPPLTAKELFAPAPTVASIKATRKSSIGLTGRASNPSSKGRRSTKGSTEVEKEETWTLPDDHHFSSKLLLRLFLKPKLCFGMRSRAGEGDGELDERFWAASGPNFGHGVEGGPDDMGGMGDFGDDPYDDDDDAAGGPQWDTQFLHGDDNDGIEDFEEEGLTPGEEKNLSVNMTGEEEDLLAATRGQLKRVRPDNVNYAKRAKRVDVKKLKDSIWKELEVVTIKVKELPTAAAFASNPDTPEAFTSVIGGLRRLYPAEKMEEISTSFCFICLLHLANEKGLRIQTPEAAAGEEIVDDGLMERRAVGGLDRLRVFST